MEQHDYERLETYGLGDKLKSARRKPLVLCMKYEWITPVLTVEFTTKWYTLFLIKKERGELEVYAVHYGHLEPFRGEDESAYVDHVPNPRVVRKFAKAHGYHLDELADDLIMGRWHNEVATLEYECARCEGSGRVSMPSFSDPDKPVYTRCRLCKGKGVIERGA